MITRRVASRLAIAIDVACCAANLITIGVLASAGVSIVPSTLAAAGCALMIYGIVAADEWCEAQQSILAAKQRHIDALAAFQDDMLAKMKAATAVDVTIEKRGDSRLH